MYVYVCRQRLMLSTGVTEKVGSDVETKSTRKDFDEMKLLISKPEKSDTLSQKNSTHFIPDDTTSLLTGPIQRNVWSRIFKSIKEESILSKIVAHILWEDSSISSEFSIVNCLSA